LITLTGPGGVGKSRLGLHSAHSLSRKFPDGAWMVELAELDSPDLVPYAVARSTGVQERMDEGIMESLVAYLRERRALVVLDNCEHVLDGCRTLLGAVLSACAGLRVLCTSRERLDVPGEAVVAVSGLPVPSDTDVLPAGGHAAALRLLAERTAAVAPDFVLTAENQEAASEVCRRLDGLPLAIELAAVRLASMTAEELRERLDDRLALLARGHRIGPERGHTLQAAVDWSHELLSAEERILWRRLSVFAGNFGLRAAEDVCSGSGLEYGQVVDLIGSLVAKSIVTMEHGSRRGRYRLLETLRLYGAQRLAEAGEETTLAAAHAVWYAERFSGGYPPWWGTAAQAEALDALDVEWANVEAALDFFAVSEPDTEIGLQLAADLFVYCMVRGRYRAGRRRLEMLLEVCPAPTETRAMAKWASGFLAQATSDFEVALVACEEARRVAEQAGAERALAYALFGLGLVRLRLGEPTMAGELLAQSHERMLRVEDPVGLGIVLYFLVLAAAGTGRLSEARRLAAEGLEACEQVGEMWVRGVLSSVLGTVEVQLGDAPAGEARLKEAVRINNSIGHRWGMAMTLEGLAFVAGCSGRLERASSLLGASAALIEEEGIILVPYMQSHHDACEAAIIAGLDEASYRKCWEQGYSLSYAHAVTVALEDTPPVDRPAPSSSASGSTGELSARELEVARLVATGLSNRAIAAELFVSGATVKTHVSHILEKLALDSRVQIAAWVASHDAGSTD
jgi:predicted ATPase/DNA-binding CsgD family transcriptional regulator